MTISFPSEYFISFYSGIVLLRIWTTMFIDKDDHSSILVIDRKSLGMILAPGSDKTYYLILVPSLP